MTDGQVRLAVPASPEFLRITRLVAASVAGRAGFTLDQVEDLRIAIDEACHALMGTAPRPGTMVISYHLSDRGLVMEGHGQFRDPHGNGIAAPAQAPALSPLAARIMAAVVDSCEMSTGPEGPSFRLLKLRGNGRGPEAPSSTPPA